MAEWSLTNATNLFKIKYGKLSDNVYNSANVMLGRVKKRFDFTGKRFEEPVPQSFAGGVGSGTLPVSNYGAVEDMQLTAKRLYATVKIEREAIKAASNDEGAFVRMTRHTVQKGVESWMRNMSRCLFNSASTTVDPDTAPNGRLMEFADTDVTGTAAAPIITVAKSTIKEANLEEKDYVEVEDAEDGSNTLWEIISVDIQAVNAVITLARISGAFDMTGISAGNHGLFMQKSEGNDPEGLLGVLDATSGSLYSVPVTRRWQAGSQIDAGGAGIIPDLMNECMLEVQRKSGKVPNLMITSFTQFRKILNQLEDQKYYVVDPRSPELKGKISFRGVEFMSAAGPIGVFPERFCEDDRLYCLNDNYITIFHRPDFGWFDDDGTVFLRESGEDSYEARYGGYLETYIVPPFQGVITGLAT